MDIRANCGIIIRKNKIEEQQNFGNAKGLKT
jgi:hypothetical protein